MNHLFQVTMYTGQQLILEALQRWLQRPCVDEQHETQRQRRTSIKGLIVLLLKTAATGVLATVLDAAIEYRRRQLLAAAADGPSPQQSSFYSLGALSRAGIAAWKSRLLLAIDEMERQAEQYGIEPTRRFAPAKPNAGAKPQGKGAPGDGAGGTPELALSATMEQLRVLAGKPDDAVAARRLDEGVNFLVDALLSGNRPAEMAAPPPPAAGRPGLVASTSSANVAGLAEAASDLGAVTMCHICMDREVRVQVLGCSHDLCFQCARRLCNTHDHAVPQCPFCRQSINGFSAYTAPAAARA